MASLIEESPQKTIPKDATLIYLRLAIVHLLNHTTRWAPPALEEAWRRVISQAVQGHIHHHPQLIGHMLAKP
jgi:predicted secreted Zn-dependent protease